MDISGMERDFKPFDDHFPAENVRHIFAGQDDERGVYAKEVRIPRGFSLISHAHPYDHISILAQGTVTVTSGDAARTYSGPRALMIRRGVFHRVDALTEAVWYCVHPTAETDAERVDAAILKGPV